MSFVHKEEEKRNTKKWNDDEIDRIINYWTILWKQGAAIDRILGEIVRDKGINKPIDYVLCVGHFLTKVYTNIVIKDPSLK